MKKELESCRLWNLAFQVEFPLVHVLAAMEASGVAVNLEEGRRLREEFERTENLEKQVYELAGEKFASILQNNCHIYYSINLGLNPLKRLKRDIPQMPGSWRLLALNIYSRLKYLNTGIFQN